jgi:hypothetical protein
MSSTLKRLAIPLLHWSVGLVVLWQSYRTFHSSYAGLGSAVHVAALNRIRLGLSGSEIVAAILFLVPPTTIVGGYLLLAIFALAILIHTLHGDFSGMETLLVYGAAVLVSMADRKSSRWCRSSLPDHPERSCVSERV